MIMLNRTAVFLLVASIASAAGLRGAEARPARCQTTDDGSYACDFRLVEFNGSFAVSAPGKPTYTIIFDAPGYALGFINVGKGDVVLPGFFIQEADDPDCWENQTTGGKICVW